MKRYLTLGSVAGILLALLWVGRLTLPESGRAADAGKEPGQGRPTTVRALNDGEPAAKLAFSDLPVGKRQPVDFRVDEPTRSRLTRREQRDQLRDWLLFTAVSLSGLDASEINRALFDVPTVRHGHLKPVANFEYGLTRSCYLGDGCLLALLPRCGPEERKDHLAHIADEHRKNLGVPPGRVVVVEYELEPDSQVGALTRFPDIGGGELFTAAYGYHEEDIPDAPALTRFLSKAPNVTFASHVRGRLRLAGRSTVGGYRGLRLEDVAAVWQAQVKAEREQKELLDGLKREREALHRQWQSKLDALNAEYRARRLGPRTAVTEPEPAFPGLPRVEGDAEDHLAELRKLLEAQKGLDGGRREEGAGNQAQYRRRATALQAGYDEAARKLQQEQKRLARTRLVRHTGFSLDPQYDSEGLRGWFDKAGRKWLKNAGAGQIDDLALDRVGAALADENVLPLLEVIDGLKKSGDPISGLSGEVIDREQRKFQFQKARYDGDLQGTEVGMVLFYTDLLAKLWTLDYQNSLPRREIEDFRADTDGGNPELYRAETEKYPNTRIWFGPEERAYQLTEGRRGVLFGPRATRIYSASSNPLQPGKEVPTSYASDRVMAWWNDHYEDVAGYEREYERLDQYIKWSVVLAWLSAEKGLDALSFLRDVEVDRSAWFPGWVKKHPELRFRAWGAFAFHPRGYKGTSTEALPILKSEPFADYGSAAKTCTIQGGVGGAEPEILKSRPALPAGVERKAGLSVRGVDVKSLEAGRGDSLKSLRGVEYRFEEPSAGRAEMRATPADAKLPLRSRDGDMVPAPISRTVEREGTGVRLRTRSGSVDLGELEVEPRRSGFRVEYTSRAMDAAQALAREVSRTESPRAALVADPRVEAVFERADGSFEVKLRNEARWLTLATAKEPSAGVPSGWHARVGDPSSGAKTILLAWTEGKQPLADLGPGDYLTVDLRPLLDQRARIPVLARGPPAGELPNGAREVRLRRGSTTFEAVVAADGRALYIQKRHLPPELAERPELFSEAIRRADPIQLRRGGGAGGTEPPGTHPWEIGGDDSGKNPLQIQHLKAGRLREANNAFLRDPERGGKERVQDRKDRTEQIDQYLASGDAPAALDAAETAVAMYPGDPGLHLRRLEAQFALGRGEAAQEDLKALRAEAPGSWALDLRKALDDHLTRRLARIDSLLAEGRHAEALAVAEQTARLHGDSPALLLRQGLARLGLDRRAGADVLDRAAREVQQDGIGRFLDEVNRGLARNPPPATRQALFRAARLAATRNLKKAKLSAAETQLVLDEAGVELHASLPGLGKVEPARPEDVEPGSSLYLDDSAGLHSRDWSTGGRHKTLRDVLSGDAFELVRVVEPDLAFQMGPEGVRLGKEEGGPRYRRAGSTAGGGGGRRDRSGFAGSPPGGTPYTPPRVQFFVPAQPSSAPPSAGSSSAILYQDDEDEDEDEEEVQGAGAADRKDGRAVKPASPKKLVKKATVKKVKGPRKVFFLRKKVAGDGDS